MFFLRFDLFDVQAEMFVPDLLPGEFEQGSVRYAPMHFKDALLTLYCLFDIIHMRDKVGSRMTSGPHLRALISNDW